MTSDRIKEIQQETAYPDSVSVQQALLKVWNECQQEQGKNRSISAIVGRSEQLKPLDADFTEALNDLTNSKVGNEPTKKRF